MKIHLFNIMGQKVAVIHDGIINPGRPKLTYDASLLASGIYFYRVSAAGLDRHQTFEQVGKMILVK